MQDLQSLEAAIQAWCTEYLAKALRVPKDEIRKDARFARLGLDSAGSAFLLVELEEWIGLELESDLLSEYPTIAALARHLAARRVENTAAVLRT